MSAYAQWVVAWHVEQAGPRGQQGTCAHTDHASSVQAAAATQPERSLVRRRRVSTPNPPGNTTVSIGCGSGSGRVTNPGPSRPALGALPTETRS